MEWDDLTLKRLKRGIAAAQECLAVQQQKAVALARGELWIESAPGGGFLFSQAVPSLPPGTPDEVRQLRDLAASILLDGALALGGCGVRLDGLPAGNVQAMTSGELAMIARLPQNEGRRCWSFTLDGELCQSPALPGEPYCRRHFDPSKRHEERHPRGERKFCGALQRNGVTCRAVTEHPTGYCGLHRGKVLDLSGGLPKASADAAPKRRRPKAAGPGGCTAKTLSGQLCWNKAGPHELCGVHRRMAGSTHQRNPQGPNKANKPEERATPSKSLPEPLTAAEHRARADQRRATAEALKATAPFPGQCDGATKAGRRCRLPAEPGSDRCAFHRVA